MVCNWLSKLIIVSFSSVSILHDEIEYFFYFNR